MAVLRQSPQQVYLECLLPPTQDVPRLERFKSLGVPHTV